MTSAKRIQPTPAQLRRELRSIRFQLSSLVASVSEAVAALDLVFGNELGERGSKLAVIVSRLEFANDTARHFGLGEPLKSVKTRKAKRS